MLNHTLSGEPESPAILFLHGFMGSAADWNATAAALGKRFYCIAVDLPGHGASLGLPPENYTMEGTGGSLADLLDELGIDSAAIVGYSMGGRLALYSALRRPERCSALFLESASPGLESLQERATRRRADEEKAVRLESGDFDSFLRDWYRQPLFTSLVQNEEFLRQTIETRRRNEPVELARSLRGMGTGSQSSLWDELGGLTVPTMAVAGGLDEKFVGVGRRMEAESPTVDFVSILEVGHNVHSEDPAAYIGLLQGFLESI